MEWKEHELCDLLVHLQSMCENITSKSYKAVEGGLNWETVSEKIKGKTAEECKAMYQKLVLKVRKYRTMPEILNDAVEFLQSNGLKSETKSHPDMPKKPVTAFGLFVHKQSKKLPGVTGPELLSQLSKAWNNLSGEKKERYKNSYLKKKVKYEEELENFRKNHPEFAQLKNTKPRPPQPSKMFVESRLEKTHAKHPELSHTDTVKQLTQKYDSLSDKKKLKWINKAKGSMELYLEQCNTYKMKNPTASFKPAGLHLSKEEQRILASSQGKPLPAPPKSLFQYFCNTHRSSITHFTIAEQSRTLSRRYHNLTPEEMEEMSKKFKEEVHSYVNAYTEYYMSLPPDAQQCEQSPELALAVYKKFLSKKTRRKRSPPKALAGEAEEPAAMSNPKKRKLSDVLPKTLILDQGSSDSDETDNPSLALTSVKAKATKDILPSIANTNMKLSSASPTKIKSSQGEQVNSALNILKKHTSSKFEVGQISSKLSPMKQHSDILSLIKEDSSQMLTNTNATVKQDFSEGLSPIKMSDLTQVPGRKSTLADADDLLSLWSPPKNPSQESETYSPGQKSKKSKKKSHNSIA